MKDFGDFLIICLIIIIVIIALLICRSNPVIVGGAITAISQNIPIDSGAKIVFDGHNLVHAKQTPKKPLDFIDTLHEVSSSVVESYPDQDIHIVIKNPTGVTALKSKYKSKTPFLEAIKDVSQKNPKITYHIAQDKKQKNKQKNKNKNNSTKPHYTESRDDFLTIYLGSEDYFVSNDRYRDSHTFDNIKPFIHMEINKGKIIKKSIIKPSIDYSKLRPTIGNHLLFAFTQDKNNLGIYKTKDSVFPTLNILR